MKTETKPTLIALTASAMFDRDGVRWKVDARQVLRAEGMVARFDVVAFDSSGAIVAQLEGQSLAHVLDYLEDELDRDTAAVIRRLATVVAD